jgi:hypothetical protein
MISYCYHYCFTIIIVISSTIIGYYYYYYYYAVSRIRPSGLADSELTVKQWLTIHLYSVTLLRRGNSSSQGLYLRTAYVHPCIDRNSNP